MNNALCNSLVDAMARLDEDLVLAVAGELVRQGYDKYSILRLLDQGASQVGRLFEKGEYFIADLIVSGGIYTEVLSELNFNECDREDNSVGTVVIGVVRSDIHDIGKDIICSLLRSEGFRVIDLGVDASPDKFVAAALRYRPVVVAMSGVLAYSAIEMGTVIQALENAGVRGFSSLLIGGVCTSPEVCEAVRADAWAHNPMDTVDYCLEQVRKKNAEL